MATDDNERWFNETYGRALEALQRGDARGAESLLRAIQERHSGEVNSLRLFGVALLAQGRGPEARDALEAAYRRAPKMVNRGGFRALRRPARHRRRDRRNS